MKGSIRIEIVTKRVVYNIVVHRNLTILRGLSGTGKTTLCDYIRMANEGNAAVQMRITTECMQDVKVHANVLTDNMWQLILNNTENTVFFIDEDATFVTTNAFADLIQNTTNYFVIINRHDKTLGKLPISVTEIYELKTSGKYITQKQYVQYTTNTRIWNEQQTHVLADKIVTEDKGSGYVFYKRFCGEDCISADGNSNVVSKLATINAKNIAVIVDGAAYGCYIDSLMLYCKTTKQNIQVCFPESFEWLLLYSLLFARNKKMYQFLQAPIVDSKYYVSWERFFEVFLRKQCNALGFTYTKGRNLNRKFSTCNNILHLMQILGVDCRKWLKNIQNLGK